MFSASAVCLLAVLPLSAQQTSDSSSSNHALLDGEDIDGASIASSPAGVHPSAAAALPQYGGGRGGYSGYHESRWSHVAFEVGGGFTAPLGNDVNGGFTTVINDGNNYGTNGWGGNLLAGAGWAFSKRFTLLGEYQYNSSKIPGRTLSAVYAGDAVDYENAGISAIGGNVHTNSVTAEPVFYYYNSDKHKYAGYVIGGVGWYHKTINFTAPVEEETYYGIYVVNETFSSYGDTDWGLTSVPALPSSPLGRTRARSYFWKHAMCSQARRVRNRRTSRMRMSCTPGVKNSFQSQLACASK